MHILRSILRDGEPAAGGGGTPSPAGGAPNPTPTPTPAPAGGTPTPTPAPTPGPFYKGLYGDDGKLDKAALDRLPDHLKPFRDVYGKYDTIDALLNGFGNAHNMASKKGLLPLDPNAPDHVKAERKALLDVANNVPKDAKEYGITRPQDFPEEFWHQDGADKFMALAHEYSAHPEFVRKAIALQIEMSKAELAKGQEMETAFYRQQDDAFAKAARQSGMDVDRATEVATRGAGALGIDPKSPIFKNAEVRLACLRATALLGEDKLPAGGEAAGLGKVDHRAAARDIMSNPQNPLYKAWNDSAHPMHDEAVEKVNQLYRMLKA